MPPRSLSDVLPRGWRAFCREISALWSKTTNSTESADGENRGESVADSLPMRFPYPSAMRYAIPEAFI